MKKIIYYLILAAFICSALPLQAQWFAKQKNGRPAWDEDLASHYINSIIEPSGYSRQLKGEALQLFKNKIADNLLPMQILNFYALSDRMYVINNTDGYPAYKYSTYILIYKDTKENECFARVVYLVMDYDPYTLSYDYKAKLRNSVSGVSQSLDWAPYKTDEGTLASLELSTNEYEAHPNNNPLECDSIVAGPISGVSGGYSGGSGSGTVMHSSAPAEIKDGPYEQKNSAGEVTTSGQYDKGKKTGKWTYFNKGTVIREEEYTDGELNGTKTAYSPDGNKQYDEVYANGKKEGTRTDYDKTGKVDKIQNYKANMMDGPFKKYTNGKLMIEGNYANGKKDGKWVTYDATGKVTQTQVFKDGVIAQ